VSRVEKGFKQSRRRGVVSKKKREKLSNRERSSYCDTPLDVL